MRHGHSAHSSRSVHPTVTDHGEEKGVRKLERGISSAAQQDAATDEPERVSIGVQYRLASKRGAATERPGEHERRHPDAAAERTGGEIKPRARSPARRRRASGRSAWGGAPG